MGSITTPALVLRRAEYRDYDRMVTLFSPVYGRIDAAARGCRRPKSPLLNASEPFTSGEFVLQEKGGRYTIKQCQILESFFALRLDYDRLKHGVYWLKLLDEVVVREVPAEDLFLMSLKALTHLNYAELPVPMLTLAFEAHLSALSGYAPSMDTCVLCGSPVDGPARFDAVRGGVTCPVCASTAPAITNGARRILMKLPRTKFEAVAHLDGHPDWPEAARFLRRYILRRIPVPEKFLPDLA